MEDILKVAIDTIRGNTGKYSKEQASEALRQALIEMNDGSNKLDPRKFVRGSKLFSLVEEIIPIMIDEGLKEDNPLFDLVEYKNIAEGDVNEFYIDEDMNLVVSTVANGIRDIRRQRISKGGKVTIPTYMKMIRVYDDLNRLLAGRITFEDLVDKTARSFKQQILTDAYQAIAGMTQSTTGLSSDYVLGGTFDADKLVALIEHVEASTGKTARIIGTKLALSKVSTAELSDEAKNDRYNLGYYGKFLGTDMVSLRQAHVAGTSDFVLNNDKIFIVASDDKPIKVVNEGTGIMLERNLGETADLTQEYIYGQAYGVGAICGAKLGIYTFS